MKNKYPWKFSRRINKVRIDKAGNLIIVVKHYSNGSRKRAIQLILRDVADIGLLS